MEIRQLTDVTGIGPTTAAELTERGIRTVEDLKNASIEEIRAIPGFGIARATAVRRAAAQLLAPFPKTDEESPSKAKKGKRTTVGGKKDKGKADKEKKKSKKKGKKKDKDKKKKDKKKKDKKKKGKN